MKLTLRQQIEELLNKNSHENISNTPDFILAKYIDTCLMAYDTATVERDVWYGVHLEPGNKYFISEQKINFNIGDKVTYISFGKKENGIVKSISDDEHLFVVYNCGGDWNHYTDYTAARTCISDLVKGWENNLP